MLLHEGFKHRQGFFAPSTETHSSTIAEQHQSISWLVSIGGIGSRLSVRRSVEQIDVSTHERINTENGL
ncbi:MAG: hypothetical protein CML76_01600 [Rhodobiaceae bacterium]|nr:hypothetical protein [Rhodobiaceae bacterium]